MLNDTNVGRVADATHVGLLISLDVADASKYIQIPTGDVDRTVLGPSGGSALLRGHINNDGSGWYSVDLMQYKNGEVTLDGLEVREILQINNGLQDFVTRLSFHDVRLTTPDIDATYQGSMTLRTPPGTSPTSTATGAISLRMNDTGAQLLAENITLSRKEIAYGYELSGGARIYDNAHGWVDVTFDAPWAYRTDSLYPHFGGAIVGTGANSRTFRLQPLTPELASLQFTSANAGPTDRGARLQWRMSFEEQTRRPTLSAPVADAGPSRAAPPGVTVPLNGAFSSHPETPFLRFNWTLLFRPPGSAATVEQPTSVNPRITLDQPGRYLLRLEVNDQTRHDTDFVALTADSTTVQPVTGPVSQLPPTASATLGATTVVDTSLFPATTLAPGPAGSPEISLHKPSGDSGSIGGTFVADQRGVYRIVLGPTTSAGYKPVDEQFVSVLSEVHFAPSVMFPPAGDVRVFVTADVNADGKTDFLLGEDSEIELFFGAPPPDLLGPVHLAGTQGRAMAVGQLTNDARADIATIVDEGIKIFVQQPGGSFAPGVVLAGCGGIDSPIVTADLNGDGLNDIATACGATVQYFLQSTNGAFDPVRNGPILPSTDFAFATGDFNNDQIGDLAFETRFQSSPTQGNIGIIYGQTGTAMATPVYIGSSANHFRIPGLSVADVTGDGRDDLISAETAFGNGTDQDLVRVFHQTPAGQLIEAQVIALPYPRRAVWRTVVGDFDHNGSKDLAVRHAPYSLGVLYQISPGRFADLEAAAFDCWVDTVGDFNGDGFDDVACLDTNVRIMFGVKDGAFSGAPTF